MVAEIITIGDEILIGQTVDTNSNYIASQLSSVGIIVRQITAVSDDPYHIKAALVNAEQAADVIIMTGGLGPTKDDLTIKTLSDFFGMPLELNNEVLNHVESLLSARGVVMNDLNRNQALVPTGAIVLPNKIGTASGLLFERGARRFFSLPGVPFEMKHLMKEQVMPLLMLQLNDVVVVHRTVMTIGLPESTLAEMLTEWEDNLPVHIKLAYLPSPTSLKLRLSARGNSSELLESEIQHQITKLQQIIPDNIFSLVDEPIEVVVGNILSNNKLTLSVAESCTGGNIAHMVTSVEGSSRYFMGGVIAYSNTAKVKLIGVDSGTIETYGAVSGEVVSEMAKGCRLLFNTDYAIAISGIAGPGGGTDEKPVGTIWIAIAGPEGVVAERHRFGDNRERNIIRASSRALNILRLELLKKK
ncbi:competence/damage-inducible protein A [Williamwhitmania taraxaci]|uniref:CinA-like protein n=1 Tax=Williamwhitmania taraxaci TaxID=1640674 RepID=A0A1G6HIY6_9BACT|nr:competence/damage-inducible protein A [Williamwhitmania taraxaci]SDB94212.1 nicotinamide-nucleotide amidase [Williamwhitmania taraxaci]